VGAYRVVRDDEVRWVVCVIAPENDVLLVARQNERTMLAFALLGTLVAAFVAFWLGGAIARPLRLVADETAAIGKFHLAPRSAPDAPVTEVKQLAGAVEEMKRNLRSFRKYVPADLVRELVAKGEEATLGGRRATLTIHFSDIAGFTTIAETASPEELVEMLSEYLDEMTKPIFASGGTVDKFIGDAIMAFWGAPRSMSDHALKACEAALANRDRLRVLNDTWERAGRPRLDARAALHTGEVIVGNIGSHEKLDYTVIGDSVNLASRLEGLNKRYGTSLMISQTTFDLVSETMVARPLDRVSVKGKARPIVVYELIGPRASVEAKDEAYAKKHTQGFELYSQQKFAGARAIFDELLTERADDLAAKLLRDRCGALIDSPPAADWDGSEKMTTK
jgi:adenylate cyclase